MPRAGFCHAAARRCDARMTAPRRTLPAPFHSARVAMKTQYYVASSLDGFIADPHHSLDWLLQFGMTDDYPAFIRDVGAVAMGASTYEWILADLERSDQPWPYEQPAWVFTSRTLPAPPGADLRFARGDVRPVHRQMTEAAGGKNLWL